MGLVLVFNFIYGINLKGNVMIIIIMNYDYNSYDNNSL